MMVTTDLTLTPEKDLLRLETSCPMWQSGSKDPRFGLHDLKRWCGQWVRFQATIEVLGIDSSWPRLYFDCGQGFTEDRAINLPRERDDRTQIDHLVFIPRDMQSAQLRPVASAARFSLRDARATPVSRYRATAIMLVDIFRIEGLAGAATCLRDQLAASLGLHRRQSRFAILNRYQDIRFGGGSSYIHWISMFEPQEQSRATLTEIRRGWSVQPRLSIVLPIKEATSQKAVRTVNSIRNQNYTDWELCIVSESGVVEGLGSQASSDSRIKILSGWDGGSQASAMTRGLESVTGDSVIFLQPGGLMNPWALHFLAEARITYPQAGLFYSDEDVVDERGVRNSPKFRPEFNYELFVAGNAPWRLSMYRRDYLPCTDQLSRQSDGAFDYDLMLRVVERLSPEKIVHVPRVLFHSTVGLDDVRLRSGLIADRSDAARRAVEAHFSRMSIDASVSVAPELPEANRVHFSLPRQLPKVSIVVLTRDHADLLEKCLESIACQTTYPNYEVVIIDNGSTEPQAVALLKRLSKSVRVLPDDSKFNYSALNNRAASQAQGTYLCLLNNDIEVLTPNWIEELLSFAAQPGIGAVGARLWYPDGRLQHGGVVLGIGGVAGHAHRFLLKGKRGYLGRAVLQQSFSAVTGACMMIRKSTYHQVGGFDETLCVTGNDIDFCLRVREAGYRNIWTPYAEMIHNESSTRGRDVTEEQQARFNAERLFLMKRWGNQLMHDPAYSPNLTLRQEDFSLAWPPIPI